MRIVFLVLLVLPFTLTAQSLSEKMDVFFETKQYEKAETYVLDYLRTHPNNLEAIELLGDTYGFQKRWDDAIKVYKKLVDIKPQTANYHYKYGGVLGMKALKVSKFRAAGLIGDLKQAFTRAAELDPEHIGARRALVELYMELPMIIGGSKNKALKYANELQQISPVEGYLAKGFIYEFEKDYDTAEENYKNAIQAEDSKLAYQKLIHLYELSKNPVPAILTLEEALQKYDETIFDYQIAQLCALYNIQLEKGLQHLNTFLINKNPNTTVPREYAYLRKAQLLRLSNKKKEALESIDDALSIRSNFKEAKKEKELILSLLAD